MSAAEPITTVIEANLRLLHASGDVREVRILGTARAGTVIGYFDDPAAAAAAVAKYDGKAEGVYFTVNPVAPALLARSPNRLQEWAKHATKDPDVVRRRWFPIDVDPVRAKGISATKEEATDAARTAREIKPYLEDDLGWPAGVLVASGNGAHLYYAVDLPNDVESRDLLQRCLAALAEKFNAPGKVDIDKSVFNAARIMKVPGTMACKGDNLPERPHRRSRIVEQPEQPACVPRSALEALAGPPKAKGKGSGVPRGNGSGASFDVEEFMARHALAVRQHKQDAGADTWELAVCPVNSEHDAGEAFVRRAADGVLSAGCQHQSCTWKWDDLREKFEPGYKERRLEWERGRNAALAKEKAKAAPMDEPAVNAPPAGPFHLTELGNAERLAARHRGSVYAVRGIDELRGYDPARGIYSADHGLLVRYASDVVRSMYVEAADALTDEAKDLRKHAARSEAKRALDAMLELSKSLVSLEAEPSDFDADPEKLNTQSGVVDLVSGDMHPHDPKYRMTKIAGCGYTPAGPTPMWDEFLARIFEGDAETIGFMQRLFGYALTGYTGEQIFAILFGAGANGKSVLVDCWQAAMGDYAGTAAMRTFLAHRTEAVRTDLATLNGRRLVSTSESKPGQVIDAATIKVLTSKHVTCRFNYARGEFTYTPQYLVVLDTNFKPQVQCDDYAIKRRVLLVPFRVLIPDDEQDTKFTEKLVAAELPGILAWGVAGARDYLAGGLRIPETVRAATDEYRAEMDALHEFWGEWLVFGEAGTWTTAKALRDALVAWAGENGVEARDLPKGSEWGRMLHERGARRDKKKVNRKNTAVWYAVRIVGEEAQEAMI